MPKFSIIIPVYNTFRLMNKCLEYLENQEFKDFEVVIVDDCSTDNSYENLKKYKVNSKLNINLSKNDKNLGPGKSRNHGMDMAKGKYILFLDSDDFIEIDTLKVLNDIIEKNSVDCIIYDYVYYTNHNKISRKSAFKVEPGIISKSDALMYSTSSTCGKVYLLENLKNNDVKFPDLMRNEDLPFNKLAIASSKRIYYSDKSFYNYVNNENSITHDKQYIDIENNIIGFSIIEEKLKDKYYKEVEAIFLKHYLYAITMNMIVKKEKSKNIKEHINDCLKKYPNVLKNESINYLPKFQKICLKAIKIKSVFLLRALLMCKKVLKGLI